MSETRRLYRADQWPTFQNRMFGSRQAARQCTRGDIYVMNRNDLAEIQFLTARQFNHITRTHEQL